MSRSAARPQTVAVSKKNFDDHQARSFRARVRGQIFQGFVVRKGDKFFAYQNLCQHLPITLDLGDDQFFTHDKAHLQCHMHGAIYQIETGFCIGGPCQGASLLALSLEEGENHLVITIPENFGRK